MVSGINKVEKMPVNMKKAKISRLNNRRGQVLVLLRMEGWNSHVLDESVGATDVTKSSETDLGNDRSELTTRGRDTVCGRTVTGGEDLTRNDEGGGVGAKVLEKVGQAVEEDESLPATIGGDELVVCETHDDESASEDGETHELDRLASPSVDEKEGDPVSGDETCDGEDQVADGDVVQVPVDLEGSIDVCWGSETDGGQDDRGVETEAVESDLKGGDHQQRNRTNWERKGVHRERTKTRRCPTEPFRSSTGRSAWRSQPSLPWGHQPCG